MSTHENRTKLFHCQISGVQPGATAIIFLGDLWNTVIIQQWGAMNLLMAILAALEVFRTNTLVSSHRWEKIPLTLKNITNAWFIFHSTSSNNFTWALVLSSCKKVCSEKAELVRRREQKSLLNLWAWLPNSNH